MKAVRSSNRLGAHIVCTFFTPLYMAGQRGVCGIRCGGIAIHTRSHHLLYDDRVHCGQALFVDYVRGVAACASFDMNHNNCDDCVYDGRRQLRSGPHQKANDVLYATQDAFMFKMIL